MKNALLLLLIALLLTACTGSSTPLAATATITAAAPLSPTLPPSPTVTEPPPSPTLTEPSPTLAATSQASSPPRPQYHISAELDYGWRTLTARQQAVIPHPADQPLSEIVLVVQPNWYPGTFHLDSLTWEDGSEILDYTLDGIRLSIPLATPWNPGVVQTLEISYTLQLPPVERGDEFGPNPFGFTDRQINLVDWQPFVPPFVAGEWLVHNPWYYGEHLVYSVADYTLDFALTNAPAGTLIAASAPDMGQGEMHHYEMAAARNFVLSISPEYRVVQEDVGGVTLYGYSFPYEAEIGQAAFAATVEAFRLYQQLFGPYPHTSLALVEADFEHGMEYDGLYYLSKGFYNTYDGTPATYLVAIAVHETAHQWWFGLVGNDQALEPWLDEALCTYTELLYYEQLHPETEKWWWDYRVDYYDPQGWVDLSIYAAGGYRPYRDAVYLNGMKFLLDLRTLVGEEVFADFLQDYVARNTQKIATADDFFAILREHSDADWSLLKTKYFEYP